jgi:hypothetical protein
MYLRKEATLTDNDGMLDQQRLRVATFWLAILAVICAGCVFAFTIYVIATQFIYWQEILKLHFAAIVGLPGAAAVAFVIVVFLRQTDGPVEFEGLGFKFKGAAGQVVMWVLCFLAIAIAIKAVW